MMQVQPIKRSQTYALFVVTREEYGSSSSEAFLMNLVLQWYLTLELGYQINKTQKIFDCMYLEKVNMMTLCEIFQLGAYDDDIHRLSVQSKTGWHLKSNDSPSQLIPIQKTKMQ
jgi:hypothetical protein